MFTALFKDDCVTVEPCDPNDGSIMFCAPSDFSIVPLVVETGDGCTPPPGSR
jgi:hypothetical protein